MGTAAPEGLRAGGGHGPPVPSCPQPGRAPGDRGTARCSPPPAQPARVPAAGAAQGRAGSWSLAPAPAGREAAERLIGGDWGPAGWAARRARPRGSADGPGSAAGERSLENVAGRPRLDSLSSVEEDDYDTLADIDYDKNVIRTKVRPAPRPPPPRRLLPAGWGEPLRLPLLPAIPLRGRPGPQGQAGAAEEVPDLLLVSGDSGAGGHRAASRPGAGGGAPLTPPASPRNIATIAVFYALPVIQLVITYQTVSGAVAAAKGAPGSSVGSP